MRLALSGNLSTVFARVIDSAEKPVHLGLDPALIGQFETRCRQDLQ